MMHKDSTHQQPRLARCTSMTQRRHLGTKGNRDRCNRFITHQPNLNEIKHHQDELSGTNSYSISPANFNPHCSKWGVTKGFLGPLYEQPIFRKMRWRTSIGEQRDFAFLKNLIHCKFGQGPPPHSQRQINQSNAPLSHPDTRRRFTIQTPSNGIQSPSLKRLSNIILSPLPLEC
jgi:hypothetical protein